MREKDYRIGAVMGILMGVLLLPTLFIIRMSFPYAWLIVPIGSSLIIMAGLWLGSLLEKQYSFGIRFSKYAAAGLLSFSIDFAILNVVSKITGITAGLIVGWINIPGFAVAVVNAYLWNTFWVFKKNSDRNSFSRFSIFLVVAVIGLFLNSVLMALLTTYIAPPPFLSPTRWLNLSKTIATAVVISWNFFGYTHIVFR